ncbi:MAG: PEP-CTERM sorting domain-containing protein [Pirellulaceae bacterium]|nr:PEP-CTERM sorting domain-containing protein [Planctomycetales bacterium]
MSALPYPFRTVGILAIVLMFTLPPVHGSTVDRLYEFGDPGSPDATLSPPSVTVSANVTNGAAVGFVFNGQTLTGDGAGVSGAFQDLRVVGSPKYASISGQPLGGSGFGIHFNGVSDYLVGENLNNPAISRASLGYTDDSSTPAPGPLNYNNISNRFFQLWVKPDGSGLNNGQAQDVVLDSNQHGVRISAGDTWVLRYGGNDFNSQVAVDTNWHHVMVARPNGPANGSMLWVDGIAVGAIGGGYDGSATAPNDPARLELVVGANTSRDETGFFTGGNANFFAGTIDDLRMSVIGDNSSDVGPPPGQNYGPFNFAIDNEFAAAQLANLVAHPGDINLDGVLNNLDKNAFIAGWLHENRINGVRVGDLTTLAAGDLNFDGVTNLGDLALMQSALAAQGIAGITPAQLATPEPSTIYLLVLAGVCGCCRLRRCP